MAAESSISSPYLLPEIESYLSSSGIQTGSQGTLLQNALSTPPMITTLRIQGGASNASSALEELDAHGIQGASVHPILSDCLFIPLDGPRSVQPCSSFIICDRSCGEAVLRGSNIFSPGVLGSSAHSIAVGDRISIYSDVQNKTLSGEKLDFSPSSPRFVFLGNGIAEMTRLQMFSTPRAGVAVRMDDCIYRSPPLNNVAEKSLFLQNLPSLLVGHLLSPQPGDRVLDMCAAPGGKTTHLADLMKLSESSARGISEEAGRGQLFAFDRSESKVVEMKKLFSRFDIPDGCIHALRFNAAKACDASASSAPSSSAPLTGPPFPPCSFDRILLDPPCSGVGLRPRLATILQAGGHEKPLDLNFFRDCAVQQRRFLRVAAQLLKPGGKMVYSTCTVDPSENEEAVRFAIDFCKLRPVLPPVHLRDLALPGLSQGPRLLSEDGEKPVPFNPDAPLAHTWTLSEDERMCCVRFDPLQIKEHNGFFACILEKPL